MTEIQKKNPGSSASNLAIDVKDIHCSAGKKEILHGVSLAVGSGEIIGLLGPNGAGKTTLIKLICGLGRTTQGELRLKGELVTMQRTTEQKQLIGLVPQENNMERELTVRESMICYGELYGVPNAKQRAEEVLRGFNMAEWADKRPEMLSGGMHRRAMIARAYMPSPEIMILDEPSVGLDPMMRQEIWAQVRRLKQAGTTILLTTHYMEEAEELCNRIAIMEDGRILMTDTTNGIKSSVAHGDELTLEEAYLRLVGREEAAG